MISNITSEVNETFENKCVHSSLVQWLKLSAWKVGDRGFEPRSGIQVSKKQNVFSLLTRKDLILWGASAAER